MGRDVQCRPLFFLPAYAFSARRHRLQTSAQARRERRECRESGTDPTEMDVDTSDLETRGRRRSYDPTRVRTPARICGRWRWARLLDTAWM